MEDDLKAGNPLSEPTGDESVTLILQRVSDGEDACVDQLLPLVYNDLKAICVRHLGRERVDHTLQPTALVHEAYLRLVRQEGQNWSNRAHFFAIASRIIRRILVDHARAKGAQKRDGGIQGLEARTVVYIRENELELLDLDEALGRLGIIDPEAAQVVEMRFFGALTTREVAEALRTNEKAVSKHWNYASAWLRRELSRGL